MAKKRKKSNKRERIPVIDFLIDIGRAATLDCIANKRRKAGRKPIDPYAVAGIAVGTGLVHDTEGLIGLGGVLGAMGAFDEEPILHHSHSTVTTPTMSAATRYAWRLNCEDGAPYGVNPEAYETREQYHQAIKLRKHCDVVVNQRDLTAPLKVPPSNTDEKNRSFIYCQVELEDTGDIRYYRTENKTLKVGDRVVVPIPSESCVGIGLIQSISQHTRITVPVPIEDTGIIYGIV